ncbi:MAG: hypothetical protein ABIJ92_00710 [Candidatus Aenigmatarchaeota archaeon]
MKGIQIALIILVILVLVSFGYIASTTYTGMIVGDNTDNDNTVTISDNPEQNEIKDVQKQLSEIQKDLKDLQDQLADI